MKEYHINVKGYNEITIEDVHRYFCYEWNYFPEDFKQNAKEKELLTYQFQVRFPEVHQIFKDIEDLENSLGLPRRSLWSNYSVENKEEILFIGILVKKIEEAQPAAEIEEAKKAKEAEEIKWEEIDRYFNYRYRWFPKSFQIDLVEEEILRRKFEVTFSEIGKIFDFFEEDPEVVVISEIELWIVYDLKQKKELIISHLLKLKKEGHLN
jgi:hypothetical protein